MPSHSTRATVPGCPLDRLDGAQVPPGGKTPPGGQKLNWLATCFGRGPATSYKARRFLENPSPAGLGLSGGFGWAAGALEVYCGQGDTQIGQRGPKIGQEGPQNWPRKAPDWSRKTHNWFCFLAKYAKHVGAGCSGQMWVAFGDLPSMYVLSM